MIVIRSEWPRRVLDGSWWYLQADVAWGRTLLAIATMQDGARVRSDVYLYLGDRYWRLARRHFDEGRHRRSERLVRKARKFFRAGGGVEPPPFAAAAMPIPAPRPLLKAIGGRRR
jgi:hypothetical protein